MKERTVRQKGITAQPAAPKGAPPKTGYETFLALLGDTGNTQAAMETIVRGYLDSLATIEDENIHKSLLKQLVQKYVELENRVDDLLKNTLPEQVAEEIKYEGQFLPRPYDCSILFTDLVGFTKLAEKLSPETLVGVLDTLFRGFDGIVARFRGTKIKTIGDAYMAIFGSPDEYEEHAAMAVRTGLAFLEFLNNFDSTKGYRIEMRIGIHTGKLVAGVVGRDRMQFDVFGDNVNVASRFESSGMPGRVNVSQETFERVRGLFAFEERGEIALKNKAPMKAYFVLSEREE
jgi:adenylate cyclase